MINEAVFAGFGGQGIMLMGQMIAYAGMYDGKNVSWFPSYGPEMRGGTANCSVVVSDEPVGSPVISEPNIVVAMNRPSLDRFEATMKSGGTLFYNSSLIDVKPKRTDIKVVAIPANDLAQELGNTKVANVIVLGAILKATKLVSTDNFMKVLQKTFGEKKQELLAINKAAFEKGIQLVS